MRIGLGLVFWYYVCASWDFTLHLVTGQRQQESRTPSLPAPILPESLPQLVTQDRRLPPENCQALILFGYTEVTP